MPAIISKAVLVTNIQRHISFNPLRLEMGLERQIQKYLLLFFFRADIMTIFSETCVVAHTCIPSTLVQGQEGSKASLGCIARPGFTPQNVCTPILLQLLLSLKFPLDHKVAATDPVA